MDGHRLLRSRLNLYVEYFDRKRLVALKDRGGLVPKLRLGALVGLEIAKTAQGLCAEREDIPVVRIHLVDSAGHLVQLLVEGLELSRSSRAEVPAFLDDPRLDGLGSGVQGVGEIIEGIPVVGIGIQCVAECFGRELVLLALEESDAHLEVVLGIEIRVFEKPGVDLGGFLGFAHAGKHHRKVHLRLQIVRHSLQEIPVCLGCFAIATRVREQESQIERGHLFVLLPALLLLFAQVLAFGSADDFQGPFVGLDGLFILTQLRMNRAQVQAGFRALFENQICAFEVGDCVFALALLQRGDSSIVRPDPRIAAFDVDLGLVGRIDLLRPVEERIRRYVVAETYLRLSSKEIGVRIAGIVLDPFERCIQCLLQEVAPLVGLRVVLSP